MSRSKRLVVLVLLTVAVVLAACAPAATPEPEVITKVETKVITEKEVVVVTPTPPPAKTYPPLEEEEEIRIGVWLGMTGAQAAGSKFKLEGTEMAHEERPDVNGVPVRLILMDDRTEATESVNVVARLIEQEKVHALLGGSTSGLTLAGGQVAEEYGIPNVCYLCSNPATTTNRYYNFSCTYTDAWAGLQGAKYAALTKEWKTVAMMVNIQRDYSVGITRFFRDAFIELTGGDPSVVLGFFASQNGDTDFTAQLTAIKDLDPDFIHTSLSYQESVLVFQQAAELGLDIPWMGVENWDYPDFIGASGPAVEGACCAMDYDYRAFDNPVANAFVDRSFELDIMPNHNQALAYDGYMMLLDAIDRAGTLDPEAITQALYETDGFLGCSGPITIPAYEPDKDHHPYKAVVVRCVENGQWEVKDVVLP